MAGTDLTSKCRVIGLSLVLDVQTQVLLVRVAKRLWSIVTPATRSEPSLVRHATESALRERNPRFPMEVADFRALLGSAPAVAAPWFLHWSPRDWDRDFHGAARLYLNGDQSDFIKRIKDQDGPTLQVLLADVMGQICERLINDPEADDIMSGGGARVPRRPSHSLGWKRSGPARVQQLCPLLPRTTAWAVPREHFSRCPNSGRCSYGDTPSAPVGPRCRRTSDRAVSWSDGPSNWTGFDSNDLPKAVRFADTGGSPASHSDDLLTGYGTTIVETSKEQMAFGNAKAVVATHARFDAELSASFAGMPLLSSGEALRDDFWTFVGASVAPDVVYWRFGEGPRKVSRRCAQHFSEALVARASSRQRESSTPGAGNFLKHLLKTPSSRSLSGQVSVPMPILAKAVAERHGSVPENHHGKGAMEPIMRRAALRVRIWNEIRSLADLPAEALESVLDGAFGLPAEDRHAEIPAAERTLPAGTGSRSSSKSGGRAAIRRQPTGVAGTPRDAIRREARAARLILTEARRRRWLSPKAKGALTALQEGTRDLHRSERNALAYLLERMRSLSKLRDENGPACADNVQGEP